MKCLPLLFIALCTWNCSRAQTDVQSPNIFIIAIDGYRWQELFGGADSLLVNDPQFVKDTSLVRSLYWEATPGLRRKKLMPFIWNVVAAQGQIFGNRPLGCKMDVTNWYRISYPGYNEMLTGYADPLFIPNVPLNNRNINILEYLDRQPSYKGSVVAFTSWNIFPYIFNEKRSHLPLSSGYRFCQNIEKSEESATIDAVQGNVLHKHNTRYDQLTYLNAKEYIEKKHPKIVFLGFGETDECAHAKRYDMYLQKAGDIDRMISELWYYVQTDSFYRGKTTFVITTDHGRGSSSSSWFTHGLFTRGSSNTWLALLGPDILPKGEMQSERPLFQKQIAATIAMLANEEFEMPYVIGKCIPLQGTKNKLVKNEGLPVASK
jgi:hypothetical protein